MPEPGRTRPRLPHRRTSTLPNGRVALISATSPAANASAARAGEQRRDMKGRPGANFIGYTTEWVVDDEAFDALRTDQ